MGNIFITLLNVSITASYIILAVLFLRLLLKKAPKWAICLLWGIVALRLILPFSIESEISLIPSSNPITVTQSQDTPYKVSTGIDAFDNGINKIIINDTNTSDVSDNKTSSPSENTSFYETSGSNITNTQNNITQVKPKSNLFDTLGIIWIFGMSAILIYGIASYVFIYKKVNVSLACRDNIYYCDSIDSPFIFGIIKPQIYLPSNLSDKYIDYVISHEQAHLKRCDHLWKPFGFLLLAIYWFNPFIWLSYILLCRDIESACDEKVIKNMDTADIKGYSFALLSCSTRRKMIAACPVAFGEVGVKERIKSILNYRKPAFWIIAVTIVTSLAVAVCFLTNPKTEDKVALSFLPLEFSASGNGAWHQTLTLNPDGTFSGKYTDWDAVGGDDYPKGTYIICEFSGMFKDIKVNDDYSYSLTLAKFESKYKKGKEWIEDETKYIATDSLDDMTVGKKFLLYKPDTPIDKIDESVLIDWPYRYDENNGTLSCYTLYNPDHNKSYFSNQIFTASESEISTAYNQLMTNLYSQTPDFYYAIKDIDGNGVKELIIKVNTAITVYTYEYGIKQLDSYDFVTGTARMFESENPKYPGIFAFTVGGGCDHYSYMTLNNGYLTKTELCEYWYSADEPYWNDISDNKEMIAEAKSLYNENRDIEFLKFEPTASSNDSNLPIDTTPTSSPLSLNEVKNIFEPLLKKAIEVEQTIINDAGTFDYDSEIAFRQNDGDYSLITDEDFQTIDDVWNYAYTAFTVEAAQRTFSDKLDQSSVVPRFLEKDGKLYYNRNAHGYNSRFDMDSLKIINQFENAVVISINNYLPGDDETPSEKLIFIMVNTQNGWRLANTETESRDIDASSYTQSAVAQRNNASTAEKYFEKILNNEQSFYSTNKKADVILSDYNKKVWKYSYVDMDNDNIDELAIELESGDILILRIDVESVIGFEFGMRGMYQINTDGSFLWNENTGNTYGCSRLEFTGKTYKTIELWRVENNESGFTAYYIDGKTATKEEADSLIVPPSINWNSFSTAP